MPTARISLRHLCISMAISALLLISAACGGGSKTPTTPPATAPTIASFTASAATITAGGSTTLSWTVSNATTVSIDHGVGTVAGNSVSVSPTTTTTYTLTATSSSGKSATATVTITVNAAAAPTISSFTASDTLLNPVTIGTSSTTLSWTVSGATRVSIDNGVGTVTGNSVSVTPSATTTYTLTAANDAGAKSTASVTIRVRNKLTILAGIPDSSEEYNASLFNQPWGIAIDTQGSLYVADYQDNAVYKVTADGVVTTIANGSAGSSPNSATLKENRLVLGGAFGGLLSANGAFQSLFMDRVRLAARNSASLISNAGLNSPEGVAVSADGKNIYVADTGNYVVRHIAIADDGSASISTLAGSIGVAGSADGVGAAANFIAPEGLALGDDGILYLSDGLLANGSYDSATGRCSTANVCGNTIRAISVRTGSVETIAGTAGYVGSADGVGPAARFYTPASLALDGNGNLYIADAQNYTIRKMAISSRQVTTIAGSARTKGAADGSGNTSRFNLPYSLAYANGSLYVADAANNAIRKILFDPQGTATVSTVIKSASNSGNSDGPNGTVRIYLPMGLVSGLDGKIYFTDSNNKLVRSISLDGNGVATVSTLAGLPPNSGTADGVGSNAKFNRPIQIGFSDNGDFYIADTRNHTIRKIVVDVEGMATVSTIAGLGRNSGTADGSGGEARFNRPTGLAVDRNGYLYVADNYNSTIRKIVFSGGDTVAVSTLAGKAGTTGKADGVGSSALFNQPALIATDTQGNLYVSDYINGVVRKVDPISGAVSTLNTQYIYAPQGIAVDKQGNIFIASTLGDQILKMNPSTGAFTTFAGTGVCGHQDGPAATATICSPMALAFDSQGNLYFTDIINNLVRRIATDGTISTVIGVPGSTATVQGTLPASVFQPLEVAIDSTDNLYITVPNAVLTLAP